METALDPQIINLTKAIRQTETGGDFNAKGGSGEWGAYQFTKDTWNSLASKYGINAAFGKATPQQQNEAAYKQVKEWKDAGYNPGQIASMWNAGQGEPDAYTGTFSNGKPSVGVNKYGVKFNVPNYAKSVATAYQTLKMGGNVGVDPTNPSSIAGTEMQPEQTPFQKASHANPLSAQPQFTPATEAVDIAKESIKNVANIYKNAPQDFIDQYIGPNSSHDPSAIKRVIGNSLGGAMSIMNTILAPITGTSKATLDVMSKYMAHAITSNDKAMNSPLVSNITNLVSNSQGDLAKLSTTHPEAVRNLGNSLNLILLGLSGGSEGGVGLDKPIGSVEGIATGAGNVAKAVKGIPGSIKEGFGNKLVEGAKTEWAKPTSIPNASYNKATRIFDEATAKGHNIPDTLVNNGVKLSQNIQDGKYVTADTAEQIRTDAGKMSYETLRPALEEAAPGVQKVPTENIIKKTVSDIRNSKGFTASDIESQIARVEKEGEALLKKYPDGMDLVDLHDNKITYSKNGGYTFGDTPDTGNIKAVNRAFGRSFGGTLEKDAPKGIPVKEFNAELAKQYQAADYLDALNNKKVPVSIASKIAKTASKVVGATVGESLGGGIMGGVGGYHIGGMIESTFENMPNPFKEYFLRNLEKTNPEAFAKVADYLGMAKSDRMARLLLPAPQSIEMPAPEFKGTSPEQLRMLQAQNNARIKQQQMNNTLRLPPQRSIQLPSKSSVISPRDLEIEQLNNSELLNSKMKSNTKLPPLKSISKGKNALYNKNIRNFPKGK